MGIFKFIGESADYFLTRSEQALAAIRLITDTMGISLIASEVMQMLTLKKLLEKDVNIVQGKVAEMIKLI